MNKNVEKEEKRAKVKGQKKDNKSGKVNKARVKAAEDRRADADDVSNRFPNFSNLTEEERQVFFQALTEARKNVEARGVPTRRRFGTVHDEYLKYFDQDDDKKAEADREASPPPRSDPGLEDGPRPSAVARAPTETSKKTKPPPPPSSPQTQLFLSQGTPELEKRRHEAVEGKLLMDQCETMIQQDTNQMVNVYLKKKKKNEARAEGPRADWKRKTPSETKKEAGGRGAAKKKKSEGWKWAEARPKSRDTPRYDALTSEEKDIFFNTLQEARNNIVGKHPHRKAEVLPMEAIASRYGRGERPASSPGGREAARGGEGKKNVRVKVTLTSGDNERIFRAKTPNNLERLCERPHAEDLECCGARRNPFEDKWKIKQICDELSTSDDSSSTLRSLSSLEEGMKDCDKGHEIKTVTDDAKTSAKTTPSASAATKVTPPTGAGAKGTPPASDASKAAPSSSKGTPPTITDNKSAYVKGTSNASPDSKRTAPTGADVKETPPTSADAKQATPTSTEAKGTPPANTFGKGTPSTSPHFKKTSTSSSSKAEISECPSGREGSTTPSLVKGQRSGRGSGDEKSENVETSVLSCEGSEGSSTPSWPECENLKETCTQCPSRPRCKDLQESCTSCQSWRGKEESSKCTPRQPSQQCREAQEPCIPRQSSQQCQEAQEPCPRSQSSQQCREAQEPCIPRQSSQQCQEAQEPCTPCQPSQQCQEAQEPCTRSQSWQQCQEAQEQCTPSQSCPAVPQVQERRAPSESLRRCDKELEVHVPSPPRAECEESQEQICGGAKVQECEGFEPAKSEKGTYAVSTPTVPAVRKVNAEEKYDAVVKAEEAKQGQVAGADSNCSLSKDSIPKDSEKSRRSAEEVERCLDEYFEEQRVRFFADERDSSEEEEVADRTRKDLCCGTAEIAEGVKKEVAEKLFKGMPTSTKVMIVDDNVIDKIRKLIYYLEAKAGNDARLEQEYIKLLVDYVDYLSKVLEALVRKKESEAQKQVQSAYSAEVRHDFPATLKQDLTTPYPRSVSGQELKKPPEKKKKDDKRGKEKKAAEDEESSSSESSGDEEITNYRPPPVTSKKLITTKIRTLQDLLNKRAEFVQESSDNINVITHPEVEYVPPPNLQTVKLASEEEEEEISKVKDLKILRFLVKCFSCGRKRDEDDGIFENLKGEAVRVDVCEGKPRDAASATLNSSTMEVLKAAGRKRVIEKFYSRM